MYNLRKEKIIKESMALGPRAIMPGNFAAGARKFRLVEINDETTPNIAKIRDSINATYAADGGQLYFLFAAENKYSEPMDVSDERMIERMQEELDAREAFVDSVVLRDVESLDEKEQQVFLDNIGLREQLAHFWIQNMIKDPTISAEVRQQEFENQVESTRQANLIVLMHLYSDPSMAHLFEPLTTNDKSKAHPMRFGVDVKRLWHRGYSVPAMSPKTVYRLYMQYTNSAGYHPELEGKGEIEMLRESIKRSSENIGEKYDVRSYINKRISEIKDRKKQHAMREAWVVIQTLRLPLQNPSWVSIGWPQGKTDFLNGGKGLPGKVHGDNRKIEDLRDLTFMDPDTERKLVEKGGEFVLPSGTEGRKLPVTPQTTLLEIVGSKPSSGRYRKTPEVVRDEFLDLHRKTQTLLRKKYRDEAAAKASKLRYILVLYKNIRDNINSIPHTDVESFYYLYDEICHLYFEYNRERYGDGIMLRFSAFFTEPGRGRVISPSRVGAPGQTNRPFIPTTLHNDLREVILSVQYAYGTDIPQLAATSFPSQSSRLLDESNMAKVAERAAQKGLTQVTLIDNVLEERPVPLEELHDFLRQISQNKVLVYRIQKGHKPNPEDGSAEIVWYAGMRSFGNRYDQSSRVERQVYDPETGGLVTISGFGDSRISTGRSAVSKDFKISLARGISNGNLSDPEREIGVADWESVYIGNDFMDVYRYANARYGFDYDPAKIEAVVSKHIRPITPEFIAELNENYQAGIVRTIKSTERQGAITIITESTDQALKEIITEISSETEVTEPEKEIEQPAVAPAMPPASVTPQTADEATTIQEYQYTPQDVEYARQLQNQQDLSGGIDVTQQEVAELQSKGYVIEQDGERFKIVQFPPWSRVSVPVV